MPGPGDPVLWAGLCAVAGWYLTGLAVTVALVVYPAFALVGRDRWRGFHAAHSSAITRAVAPAWLVEGLATVGWLVTAPPDPAASALAVIHAVAAAGTVALTLGSAVPRHRELAAGPRPEVVRRLRAGHRWRTAAWSGAAVVATAGAVLGAVRG